MMGIVAALELLQHTLEGKAKALSRAEPSDGFRRQTWLSGSAPACRFVLLCLDRLAFPSPGHGVDYKGPQAQNFGGPGLCWELEAAALIPSWEPFVRKTDLAKKTDNSLEN
jgi:hypothetical protein